MPFIDVNEENFEAVLAREFKKEKFVILKFGSHYCDACQIMEMELEELCDRLTNVSVLSIDSGLSQGLTQQFFVEEIPTTVIFKEAEKQLFYRTGITLADDMIEVILKEC